MSSRILPVARTTLNARLAITSAPMISASASVQILTEESCQNQPCDDEGRNGGVCDDMHQWSAPVIVLRGMVVVIMMGVVVIMIMVLIVTRMPMMRVAMALMPVLAA